MKKLVLASILLALVVIVLGAYTRLTDAGLGCPDWPGCYGHLTVPKTDAHVAAANAAFPERPVEAEKAWNEMVHRYFAAALGFFILVIAVIAFMKRNFHRPLKLPLVLLGLVIFQGMLGMWTVTLNLLPAVVMGHLLGGFTVLSCLFLLYLRLTPYRIPGGDPHLKPLAKFAALGIVVLVCQIALGGWTSANYAALACTEFPICEGNWTERLDFIGAFTIPPAENYEFGAHDYGERMTMHIMHRIGALVTFIYLCWLALALYKRASSNMIKSLVVLMVCVLGVQVLLGVSNVVFSLPLTVAVAHNAVAACLLLVMVMLTYTLYRKI
ncbi:COX15/CtaA family protein [Alteromonas flava]|uniref:COX15/CtaA family protein n=1 Tax=Alteromonas flava TaxID=2048003 RepID=UPI000C28158D|nr:COX15/CtaA family protein [Alteromonas flava]